MSQDDERLCVQFTLRPQVTARAIWSRRSDTETWIPLGTAAPGATMSFELASIAGPEPAGDDSATARLFVEVEEVVAPGSPEASRAEARPEVEISDRSGLRVARYRALLGHAGHTTVHKLTPAADLTPYIDRSGAVAVAVGRDVRPAAEIYVSAIHGRDGVLRFRGRLNARHSVLLGAELHLKARTTSQQIVRPIRLRADPEASEQDLGKHWYRWSVDSDWADLWADGVAESDIFDAWALLDVEGATERHRVRIGKSPFLVRQLTRPSWTRIGAHAAAITPYYTFKAQKTSFQVDVFDRDVADYLRTQVRLRHLNRLRHRVGRQKPIWLVGERPNKAQDTGLAMFRHLRQTHPEIDAHYVIDPGSPELANVERYGNVVGHRSKEHVRLSLLADRVLGSHHPDFTYPLRTKRYRRAVRATRIFLQHGVMGTKWMVPNYGKGRADFVTDLFIASSRREKQYLISDFGWPADRVAVTGLSRFDSLFADDVAPRRQLLIMPTWRDWLQDDEIYLASEYHERWSSLLHDPQLAVLAKEHRFQIVFCLHPNMQIFTRLFTDAPVRVISQSEVDVQHLLKESTLLLTDYSSVGFDFAFLDKPVVYYQFDRARFLGRLGSHIDLDAELPGTVVRTEQATLDAIERIADVDFAMQPGVRERADRFLDHRDRENCERIYRAAAAARRSRPSVADLLARPIPAAGIRYWRRSRVYFPMMRLMMRLLQKLPADRNRVVFEAGVGRQYADSPRYIYEELVRRGSGLRKVWAYNRKIHTTDESTQVVQRLSPGYFWHLGRAQYWVTNQNLPHYMRRRSDGVYVQTWHGTPLKRMLLDLDVVHGRGDGYVERMLGAAAQWSLLVSPSPFASAAISRAYGYPGPTLEVGYPRNDVLVDPDAPKLARLVRERLGISQEARVILYAPTFRDDQTGGRGSFRFQLPFDLARLARDLGPDTVLLLRMHLVVRGRIKIPEECEANVLDVSSYPDIQELYLASDALVTDYSSVFFDYALLRRPIVFYAYDLDNYRDNLRGFYLDYLSEMPGPIVTTEDELLKVLGDLAQLTHDYRDRYDAFLARFAPHDDGFAARRVVDAVFGGTE